jgi:glucose-1-phosphate thymidylyltransferase
LTEKTLTVVIPMAGYGTRLRPHTWSKPKPLVQIAGKTVLDHVLDIISTATNLENCRLALIVGYLGDQIKTHMANHYPSVETSFYVQEEMLGQTHAIAMAREVIQGPTLILFSDTIVQDDLSFLLDPAQQEDGVVWVKKENDPRRFGVVDTGEDGYIQDIIEKPSSMENDLAVVGYYYFARGEDLMSAIDHQLNQKLINKGEYYIADAMKLMIDRGAKLLPKQVGVWLDAGVPDTVLETNRYLLENKLSNAIEVRIPDDVELIPPVYIHPTAQIRKSKIGPHVSVGSGCRVEDSQIDNSIIETGAVINSSRLSGALVGERAQIKGVNGAVIVGDDSLVKSSS